VRRDGAGFTNVLIGLRNELFLHEGLDTPNQLEFAEQIKVCVKSNSGPTGGMRMAIAAPDFHRRANQWTCARWCQRDSRSPMGWARIAGSLRFIRTSDVVEYVASSFQ
jgi:hypothetical protein